MDVKSLYTLIAIADYGSFADAGKAIGLSTPTVSLQVSSLEKEIGVLLFDRSTRPPALTEPGLAFVERARQVIVHWEALSERLRRDPARGILRIGAVHTTVSGLIPPALRRLQARCPDLHIRLSTALSHQLHEQLRRGSLDCAVLTEPEVCGDEFYFQRFAEEPLAVIAHHSVPGECAEQILGSNPYVRFSPMARVARIIDAGLAGRGIAIRSQMEVDTLEGVIALVANALGVSIVPVRNSAQPFPPQVRALPFGELVRRLGVLQRTDNPRQHLVKLLLQELATASLRDAA